MNTLRSALILVLMALSAFGCKKDEGPAASKESGGPLTEQEKQAIIQSYQSIATSADTILQSANPIAGFRATLASYRAYANVERASVDSNGLYVVFKKGGGVHWYIAPDVAILPYDRPSTLPTGVHSAFTPSLSGMSTRVCLVNTMDQDESRTIYRDHIAYLKQKFETSGFQVTVTSGLAADVQFFKTGLKNFGVVIIFAHGKSDDETGRTWLQTGEVGSLAGLMGSYLNEFQAKQIDLFEVEETRGGQKPKVPYYAVSDNFIRSAYTSGDMPGTIVYLGACQAVEYASMPQAFAAGGAAAVIGWTETNRIGPSVSKRLFGFLLCGKSLQDAENALPHEDRKDSYLSAQLVHYPPQAGGLRLVANERRATLNIIRPRQGEAFTERTIHLEGSLTSEGTISHGIAEVNAIPVKLSLLADRRSFLQQFGIKSGENSLKMSGLVDVPNGCACFDYAYNFQGDFASLDLWTELRWNSSTDVDFHLLRPGASLPGDLWTSSDCYYGNRTTTWGAFLDVDNTSGLGPEHITIPSASTPGTYTLVVHYYSSRGTQATTADVYVSVRNAPNLEFRGLQLNRSASRGGDVYEVCTIEFPSGTVNRVMRKITLPGLEDGPYQNHLQKKK